MPSAYRCTLLAQGCKNTVVYRCKRHTQTYECDWLRIEQHTKCMDAVGCSWTWLDALEYGQIGHCVHMCYILCMGVSCISLMHQILKEILKLILYPLEDAIRGVGYPCIVGIAKDNNGSLLSFLKLQIIKGMSHSLILLKTFALSVKKMNLI